MTRPIAAAAAALAIAAGLAPAAVQAAPSGVKLGVLTCSVASGWGFVFGSSHRLNCRFSGGRYDEHYVGRISKYGVDIGYQRSADLIWAVFAPTENVAPGALRGSYGGATAGATVGIGLSANGLIGGSTRTISLQPLSVGGSTGLNVAAGIASITLSYAAYAPMRHRHHRYG